MNRREVIALLGGAAVAWPLAARAEQTDRMRRIGVLMHTTSDETQAQAPPRGFFARASGIGLGGRTQPAGRHAL
jgi:putative ABC transport system substrate-binding protein